MDRYLLGKEIKRRRVELKLTQKQLALGICKQSIISKIENGEFFPSFELLVTLSNKLKLSINYLLESAISDQYHYIDAQKKEVQTLIIDRKFEEIFIICNKVLQNNDFLTGEHKEYFLSYQAVTSYYNKSLTLNKCVDILKQCFIEDKHYINQNQKLINRNLLAILYAENEESEKALEEFEKILLEFNKKTYNLFYLRVLFNYSNLLHNCSYFEKALLIVNEAIDVCKKVENVNMFGKFYFLMGECYIDLGYTKDEISKCFEKSLFYFDMMHNDEYIKILWDLYFEYLK